MKRGMRIPMTVAAVGASFATGWFLNGIVPSRDAENTPAVERFRVPDVIYAGNPDAGTGELRVTYRERPGESRTLFAYGRSAVASFDVSGEWCAVGDYAGSSVSFTRILRRRGDLDYVELAHISGEAWEFFRTKGNRLPEGLFDHAYVNPVAWIPGERPLLLVSLTGHDGMGSSVDFWLCVYDPVAGRFMAEFSASDDKGVVVVEAVRRKYFKGGGSEDG